MQAKLIKAGNELLLKKENRRGVDLVKVVAVDDVRQVARVNLRGSEIEVLCARLMPKPNPTTSSAQWRR